MEDFLQQVVCELDSQLSGLNPSVLHSQMFLATKLLSLVQKQASFG